MFKFISNKVAFILQSVIEELDFFCLQTPLKHQKPTAFFFDENEELELGDWQASEGSQGLGFKEQVTVLCIG